jgi:hypothetical protein
MHTLLGILLLVAGVIYPMAALVWLNQRMARQPALAPRQVGLLLALNGVLPVSLIFWGLGLIVPRLGVMLPVRMVAILASVVAVGLIGTLLMARPPANLPAAPAAPDGRTGHDG